MSSEDLRRRAVELRREGVRAKEISTVLGSGHTPWVIRKWLRDARVPPTRSRVLELAPRKDASEIAESLKVSPRRVYSVLRDADFSEHERKTTAQNVDLFLSAPREHMRAKFTQSRSFGWALLKRCSQEVDRAPVAGLGMIEIAIELLDRIRNTRRSESNKRQALCLYLLSRGLEAHAYMVTDRHMIAQGKLQAALKASAGCISCQADQLRRLGVFFGSLKRWADAYSSLNGATERYHYLGNAGHDLLGNGIANCLLLKCNLDLLTVSPEAGAVEARRGLKVLTGRESPVLFASLILALARCLQPSKDPRDVQESQELLDWCFENFKFAGVCSVARALLYWLRGNLASVMGRMDDAVEDLTLALDDARALQLDQDAAGILADLGALNPEPREVRSYIEDFCEWNDAGDLIVPSWLSNLDAEIRAVYDIALRSRNRIDASTFVALREAAGGESRMPAFIIPSQAASSILGRRFDLLWVGGSTTLP
ncbi:MAG TPA: hypothetical protein VGG06_33835 [Thermoanaerobaculia bacterium]